MKFNKHLPSVSDFIYSRIFDYILFSKGSLHPRVVHNPFNYQMPCDIQGLFTVEKTNIVVASVQNHTGRE